MPLVLFSHLVVAMLSTMLFQHFAFLVYLYVSGETRRGIAWQVYNRAPWSVLKSMFFWPQIIDDEIDIIRSKKI